MESITHISCNKRFARHPNNPVCKVPINSRREMYLGTCHPPCTLYKILTPSVRVTTDICEHTCTQRVPHSLEPGHSSRKPRANKAELGPDARAEFALRGRRHGGYCSLCALSLGKGVVSVWNDSSIKMESYTHITSIQFMIYIVYALKVMEWTRQNKITTKWSKKGIPE